VSYRALNADLVAAEAGASCWMNGQLGIEDAAWLKRLKRIYAISTNPLNLKALVDNNRFFPLTGCGLRAFFLGKRGKVGAFEPRRSRHTQPLRTKHLRCFSVPLQPLRHIFVTASPAPSGKTCSSMA
jgi:hypothetical protein